MGVRVTLVSKFSCYLAVEVLLVWSTATRFATPVGAQMREPPANCNLRGRVEANFPDGRAVPARTARVYVFYSSEYVDHGFRNKYFTHEMTLYTAGGQFTHRYTELVERDKVLKVKDKTPPSDERALEIAERSIKYADEAIASTVEWAAKHPKDAWQVMALTPDEQGTWAAEKLKPGSYDIVVRGIVSHLDAVWFFTTDLEPGQTYSLQSQPRFFCPLKQ